MPFVRLTGVSGEADDETFTKAAHGLRLAQEVVYVSGTGFTGLVAGTHYFVVPVAADTFRLATSEANALAGTTVALSADGSSGIFQSVLFVGDDDGEKDEFGEGLRRSYRTLYQGWRDTVPDFGTTHPDNNEAWFQRARMRRVKQAPALCDVVLEYEELPDTRITQRGTIDEVDIRRHPRYASVTEGEMRAIDQALGGGDAPTGLSSTAQELYEKMSAGQTSYVVGSVELVQEDFYNTNPGSITSLLGTLEDPPGTATSPPKWLIIGGDVNQESGFWRRTLVYRYGNWDTDIY